MKGIISRVDEKEALENSKIQKAKKKLQFCITELKGAVREMIFALSILETVPIHEKFPLMTNGKELFFSDEYVLDTGCTELKKEIMHITMHGLLGHFEEEKYLNDKELSWAVMDIKAHRMMKFFLPASDEKFKSDKSREPLGMELYYRSYRDPKLRERVLEEGKRVMCDDHRAWNMIELQFCAGSGRGKGSDCIAEWKEAAKHTAELLKAMTGDEGKKAKSFEELMCKLIYSSNGSSGCGNESGDQSIHAKAEIGQITDYSGLIRTLEKHAVSIGEEDVPDPVLYSYGLELYEDMPLIEPLEEAEKAYFDMIVVAADTSGSCIESLPDFLRESGVLFRQLKDRTEIRQLWYMECDAKIHTDELYEGNEIEEAFCGEHDYTGGGGTDFRPVFERLSQYEKQGGTIDCLIYYSDGSGRFPEKKPDYPCFFVYPGKSRRVSSLMPEWVNMITM